MLEIEGRELEEEDRWSPVTYVPDHAKGNAGHKDCEHCVLLQISSVLGFASNLVSVLNCQTRTRQRVDPKYLVWG